MKTLLSIIDDINDRAGMLFSVLLIPLMMITTIEVIARYIFSRPTIWAWNVNIQLFGALTVIGGGYALRHNMHVSVGLVVDYLPRRVRALLNLFTSILFFLVMGVLLWQSSVAAWESVKIREAYTSVWAPPIYHLKTLIPIAVFLLLLQGIAKFIRDFLSVTGLKKRDQ